MPIVGDGSGLDPADRFSKEEVLLAMRNRGMPLEAIRYPVTPTGLHYLLVRYDIPDVNANDWLCWLPTSSMLFWAANWLCYARRRSCKIPPLERTPLCCPG